MTEREVENHGELSDEEKIIEPAFTIECEDVSRSDIGWVDSIMWLTCKNLSIRIERREDGVSISVTPLGSEMDVSLAEMLVPYHEEDAT